MSKLAISFSIQEAKASLTPLQRQKLHVAAQILKETAHLYSSTPSLLPLWAAGVVTHGQPKSKKYEIGTTIKAKTAKKKDTTADHLHRVTATAEFILTHAHQLTTVEIEDILLTRSITMRTTRSENNRHLRQALRRCPNKDDWQELYRVADIQYELYPSWVRK